VAIDCVARGGRVHVFPAWCKVGSCIGVLLPCESHPSALTLVSDWSFGW